MSSGSPQHLLALRGRQPPPEVKGGEGDPDRTGRAKAWHRSMVAQRCAGASRYGTMSTCAAGSCRSAVVRLRCWTRPSRTSPPDRSVTRTSSWQTARAPARARPRAQSEVESLLCSSSAPAPARVGAAVGVGSATASAGRQASAWQASASGWWERASACGLGFGVAGAAPGAGAAGVGAGEQARESTTLVGLGDGGTSRRRRRFTRLRLAGPARRLQAARPECE